MGRACAQLALRSPLDYLLVAGVDPTPGGLSLPCSTDLQPTSPGGQVLVDFSSPLALDNLLAYCLDKNLPAVLATTGYSSQQIEQIQETAKQIPLFFTFNMSLGISLLAQLCQQAVKVLGLDYDIEIIEKHHNQKLDAPSGTALLLGDAINEASQNRYHYVTHRSEKHEKRDPLEIGLHSLRGGAIVGEHEVIFAGAHEVISLSHAAYSREVFAQGALKAADFLTHQPAGLYTMEHLMA